MAPGSISRSSSKVHIRAFSLGNVHHRGDQAAQIQQRMQLNGGVTTAITRPRKDGQTEINDRRVERVHGVRQVDRERVVDVEVARRPNEALREVGVDAPVARLVGVGQRRPRDARADADVIEPRLHRAETRLDRHGGNAVAGAVAGSVAAQGFGAAKQALLRRGQGALGLTLKHLLHRRGTGLTPARALAHLATRQSADIVLPTTDGREIRLRRVTAPTPEQQRLLDQLEITIPIPSRMERRM